jgi:hypothetical protein
MDRRDDQLPEDLRDIADGIRESRTEASPLQLDELKQRARRQAERAAGAPARWRRKLIATILALGLMFTSTTGVVVAAKSLGTSKKPKVSFKGLKKKVSKPKKDSSKSQYCPPSKHDDSDSDSNRDRDSDSDCDDSDSSDSDRGSDRDSDSDRDRDSDSD